MDDLLGIVPPNTTGTFEQVQHLFAAIAKAQADIAPLQKNREVVIRSDKGNYTFSYADLGEIRGSITQALAAHGLGWHSATFGALFRTTLTHADGATIYTECPAPEMRGDPKQYGGQLTYIRRYHISMLLGLAADDDLDDDGHETGATSFVDRGTSNEPAQREPMQRKAAAPGAVIDAGSLAWISRKVKALGLDTAMAEAMLTRLGVPVKPWSALTTEEFALVKSELSKASALPGQ